MLRLVNFVPRSWPDSAPRAGALLDDGIVDIAEACEEADVDCGCAGAVIDLLACADCLEVAREAVAGASARIALADVRLLAPVLRPGKVLCLAGNYEAHIKEGTEIHPSDRATPRVFMKPTSNTVCGPDDPILIGRMAQFMDWEGELAVIIGRRGKYIKAEEALGYVGGVTVLNDISERRLKIWDRPEDRQKDKWFDWLNGKWADNSAPMGPCAVPLADIGDIQALKLQTRVNGEVMQDTNTSAMIFSVARQIEYVSHMLTLEPGDIIATGTASGVGLARGVALKPGDVVEVEIEKIGILHNPVVQE
jgi:2,4-didehydro-3-deoxy-L-rhamnonate hydrolase